MQNSSLWTTNVVTPDDAYPLMEQTSRLDCPTRYKTELVQPSINLNAQSLSFANAHYSKHALSLSQGFSRHPQVAI